ncbi:MAG: type II toxin-antitoxin system RelE/ParE family toxin [Pseudomonadales bacterium]
MSYSLAFKKSALKEWRKLSPTIRDQFKKKLQQRLEQPHVASAAIRGARDIYKIKLRRSGYRLVYSVDDKTITVTVIAAGKRDRNTIYRVALTRLEQPDFD